MIETAEIIIVGNKGQQQHIWWHERYDAMLRRIGQMLDRRAQAAGMARSFWIYRHNKQINASAIVEMAVRSWVGDIQRGEATADPRAVRRWQTAYTVLKENGNESPKASIYVKRETLEQIDDLCAYLEQQSFAIPHLRVRYSVNRRMIIALALIRADALVRQHKPLFLA